MISNENSRKGEGIGDFSRLWHFLTISSHSLWNLHSWRYSECDSEHDPWQPDEASKLASLLAKVGEHELQIFLVT